MNNFEKTERNFKFFFILAIAFKVIFFFTIGYLGIQFIHEIQEVGLKQILLNIWE